VRHSSPTVNQPAIGSLQQLPDDRFVDPDLLCEDDSGVTTLRGSRCNECGAITFPAQASCPRCAGTRMSAHPLPRHGTLWTFTIQRFRPKPPYDGPIEFEPYAVGYVNLEDQVLVEARLSLRPDQVPLIGDEMELVFTPYTCTPDGVTVTTFAFRTVTDENNGLS
jgi:uncharacterized OB-fold protein